VKVAQVAGHDDARVAFKGRGYYVMVFGVVRQSGEELGIIVDHGLWQDVAQVVDPLLSGLGADLAHEVAPGFIEDLLAPLWLVEQFER